MDESNLNNFIKFFKEIIKGLATKSFDDLEEILKSDKMEAFGNQEDIRKRVSLEESKIVILLHIFYEIIKSFKSTADSRQKFIINEFKKILFCDEIK